MSDLMGMSCCISILNKNEQADYEQFFVQYATQWRTIETKEYKSYLLQFDEHSPSEVRVNVNVSQFQEFYDTFNVLENDKMYVKPEDRIEIW